MNAKKIKQDFPILKRKTQGRQLCYLDSAATSQKPRHVLKAMDDYYEKHNSNVHRGVHTLSEEATELYEGARKKVAGFINAGMKEMVFTKNATEAINLVSHTLDVKKGGEILSSVMEHHSNIVPWQLCGAKVRYAGMDENGNLDMGDYEKMISEKTRLVAVTHVSNVLGTINDVRRIAKLAHDVGALCLVDGAQSVPHMPVDVKKLGVDFLAFSGHKMLGPTGIGCLYGKKEVLDSMMPFMGGGDMIREVTLAKTTYNEVPHKFEAGTPDIAGAVGLGAAVDYLSSIGMGSVQKHEEILAKRAVEELSRQGVEIYGPKKRAGVVAFNVHGLHAHDVASMLDEHGIAVRSGHHCAQPLMERLGISSSARASFCVYNDERDVLKLASSLRDIIDKVGGRLQ
ncbi:MAG: cysteine desulfurase [Candidatus Aenigmarchaeota archaeon]|nr:cysteine desulfurase [Candidatus Aenigmarchaeota archaeon]